MLVVGTPQINFCMAHAQTFGIPGDGRLLAGENRGILNLPAGALSPPGSMGPDVMMLLGEIVTCIILAPDK